MSNQNIGLLGTDKRSGFTGTITGWAEFSYGSPQYLLTPKSRTKDEYRDSYWFDIELIEVKED